MKIIANSFQRALLMQFHYKMLLLSVLPSLLALAAWAVVLYFSLQPLIDFLQQYFLDNNGFELAQSVLSVVGLVTLKAIIIPLVAMWLLLPLMLLTALLFVACVAMPVVNQTISNRYFPDLEKRYGGSWWRSLGFALVCVSVFMVAWLVTLPFSLLLPLGMLIQMMLLGWLTYRVMAYDALATHASVEERKIIMEQHRWPLWMIGIVAAVLGSIPGLTWLGGVLSIIFLPLLAAVAVWLYVVIFMFSALWFQAYCLEALQTLRETNSTQLIQIN